jgi:1-acyl-sn-glycerol-3-phosphate acyltransferase
VGAYYSAVRNFADVLLRTASGRKVTGLQHIPDSGGVVVAANHISFWDPPFIGAAIPREMYFLAKAELFEGRILGPLIRSLNSIPIRRGTADLTGMGRAIEVLQRGGGLILFPEGGRMRDDRLHPARPGVGLIAVNANVPVVPCYITGSNRPGKWWRRGVPVSIDFGPPRTWQELAGVDASASPGRELYRRVGEGIMREIAALKSDREQSAAPGAA